MFQFQLTILHYIVFKWFPWWWLPKFYLLQTLANSVSNIVVSEYPQLTNIDGRIINAAFYTLEVSFLKWNKQMGGNTAPTE